MTSEAETPESGPPPETSPDLPSPRRAGGLPPWLPYFLVATTSAVIVGILVYFLAGSSSGSSGGAAGVVDGFIHLGQSSSSVQAVQGKLPAGFPTDFPSYNGAKLVAAFSIGSSQGTSYLVVLNSSASAQDVYKFYLDRLDKDPWQVEVGRSSNDLTAVAFSRPGDANVQGDVTMYHLSLDNTTSIYVTVQDVGNTSVSAPPFILGASRPLPPNFPTDMPIFTGKGPSTIIDTYFERASGASNYYVTFVTKDDPTTVINYYKSQFGSRGWTVADSSKDATPPGTGTTDPLNPAPTPTASKAPLAGPSIDFSDGQQRTISGTISGIPFAPDPSYTEIDMAVMVTSSRTKGN